MIPKPLRMASELHDLVYSHIGDTLSTGKQSLAEPDIAIIMTKTSQESVDWLLDLYSVM